MTFKPYPSRSGFIFLGAAILGGALAVYLFTLVPQQADWAVIFKLIMGLLLTLAATLMAVYGAMIAFRLSYCLNRNGLAIQWGLIQQRIPFDRIEAIIPARHLPDIPLRRGLKMAGLQFGWGELADYGPVKIQITAPAADSLLVVTPGLAYLISPAAPDRFINAWQARRGLGSTQDWSTGPRRSWPLNSPIVGDRLVWWLLGLAALVFLIHFGYLTLNYADLPASLPIFFNTLGQADRIADKSALLTLTVAGASVLAFNGLLGMLVYDRDKLAAYLLWGCAIVMQLSLWIALIMIMPAT
ncbi:MAG: PH domain-containing protein [Chloroflexota bacterium]